MTITSTVNTFETTGSTATSYIFNQPIHKSTDLNVYVSGILVPVSGGTNPHTVTVAQDKQSATVVFGSAPGSVPLKFERILEYKQESDLANNSLFDAESLETTLDNIVMQTQQAGIRASSSLGFDPGLAESEYETNVTDAGTLNKTKANRENTFLIFDEDGDIDVTTFVKDNVDTLAGISADITAVADIDTDVTTLADQDTNITTLSTSIGNINLIGDDLSTGLLSDIFECGSITDSSISDAGDGTSDINAVAGKATEIGRLGTVAAVADMAILGTSAIVTDMDLLGATGVIGDIETVADNIADVNNFADLYQIDDFSPSAPTTDGGGNAIASGDLAYDSTANQLKYYNGSSFVGINEGDITSVVAGTGLTGGGTDGDVTVNVIGGTGITANANDIAHTAHTGDVTGATALTIANDAVTYAKMQNVSATNKILGRDSSGAGVVEEISPADLLTMLGVEASADVTDTTNVTAAGALMDSECTDLAAVKATEDPFTAALLSKLNAIEASATADQTKSDIDGLAITTVGALSSGSIATGFGAINNGSDTITTTGAVATGTITATGLITANGGVETDINSKVVQKGAFLQSSTHQSLALGY